MSNVNVVVYPAPEDAFTQSLTLLLPDGTPFNITMDDLAYVQVTMVKLGINRGVMIGASIIMLIALLMLTKSEKRSSPVFFSNAAALLLNTIKQILMVIFLTGPFTHPYAIVATDFDRVTGIDKSNSIAVPVINSILLTIVLVSLLMQVNVISATMTRAHRILLLLACGMVAMAAMGFQLAFMVVNCQNIIALRSGFTESFQKLQKQAIGAMVVALLLFTVIFVTKLGFAIFKRRQLGFVRFGPMQVIFIMGIQTLIVPTTVASLQFVPELPEMNSWFLTLIVLSLPLSSLWASTSLDGSQSQSSSRAKAGACSSGSRTNEKTALSEKSPTLVEFPMSAQKTDVSALHIDAMTSPRGIVAEQTWNVSRSEV